MLSWAKVGDGSEEMYLEIEGWMIKNIKTYRECASVSYILTDVYFLNVLCFTLFNFAPSFQHLPLQAPKDMGWMEVLNSYSLITSLEFHLKLKMKLTVV